jgi:23S rRNA (cytosine1962-C5)-methyltransferase
MSLLHSAKSPSITLRLSRDLVRVIKRGHPWVFADALRERPKAPPGSPAVLLDNKRGQPIAWGFYDSASPLTFRVCSLSGPPTESWAEQTLGRALALRQTLFDEQTTGYRLFNGEGDGLPGLIVDVYGPTAVLQLDGPGPAGFWNAHHLARWVAAKTAASTVYFKTRSRGNQPSGETLVGPAPKEPVRFLENGVHFTAEVVQGRKLASFWISGKIGGPLAGWPRAKAYSTCLATPGIFGVRRAGRSAPGHYGRSVCPALAAAADHWAMNGLDPNRPPQRQADAFVFLENAAKQNSAGSWWWSIPPPLPPPKKAPPKR